MSVSNKEIADCFRGAKDLLEERYCFYICDAIRVIARNKGRVLSRCLHIINTGIGDDGSLNHWIDADILSRNLSIKNSNDDFYAMARLAWLDKLIEEYSGEFDGR